MQSSFRVARTASRASLLKCRYFTTKNVPGPSFNDESKPKAHVQSMPDIKLDGGNIRPYEPKEKHQRVSFEYPEAPGERGDKKASRMRWKPVLPVLVTLFGGLWGLYTYNYFTDDIPSEYLHPDKFIPFIITNKMDIDQDHYLVELTPKFNKWKKNAAGNAPVWNGLKLWSVEVKQPQIMVVRKYTPLPLEIHKSALHDGKSIITVQTEEDYKNGKLVFYIKKYAQGEVARWIYKKPVGSELELRGPYVEYEFQKSLNNNYERPRFENLPSKILPDPKYPIKPDNLVFFAAGTGIAPVLQTLLSKNPYKGFIEVFYSRRTESEVPISNYLYFLEKLDRVKFNHLVESNGETLQLNQVPSPIKSNLIQFEKNFQPTTTVDDPSPITKQQIFKTALEEAQFTRNEIKQGPSLAIVCGPDGYLNYVSGLRPYQGQGPLTGLLKLKGWNETNVFKM